MTIHKQSFQPRTAQCGDVWTDGVSFKRVLSRGGAWENVNLGSKHIDEVDHDKQEQRPEAVVQQQGSGVDGGAGGAGAGPQGAGDDGQVSRSIDGQKGPGEVTDPVEGEGVDGDGSPVV